MNTKQIGTLTAITAAALVFANVNVAFADSGYKNYDRLIIHAMEVKQAQAASKMVKVLQAYKMTLTEHQFDNKATEKRVTANTKSIDNQITGIVDLLKNRAHPAAKAATAPSAEIIKIAKFSSISHGGEEIMRVTYKVTAGNYDLRDAKAVIGSEAGNLVSKISHLSADQSSVHTVLIKVADKNAVNVKLVY